LLVCLWDGYRVPLLRGLFGSGGRSIFSGLEVASLLWEPWGMAKYIPKKLMMLFSWMTRALFGPATNLKNDTSI
jgi:hypothetical protein